MLNRLLCLSLLLMFVLCMHASNALAQCPPGCQCGYGGYVQASGSYYGYPYPGASAGVVYSCTPSVSYGYGCNGGMAAPAVQSYGSYAYSRGGFLGRRESYAYSAGISPAYTYYPSPAQPVYYTRGGYSPTFRYAGGGSCPSGNCPNAR